ncbi:TPA: tail fiber protein [Salmonella enterica subsp. diarizonae]
MGKLTEIEQWDEDVYQIETSDPVLGGPEGITNKPAKQLANRTQWLKKRLEEADNALAEHAKSRNHPDATLINKGFVKLYSGVTSLDETLAATPKAVKIAMDNANARLAKERNLADLTNVPLARQSLELGNSATRNVGTTAGTVAAGDDSRITGAMQKDQNLADVPDKAEARAALQLGNSATRDVGTTVNTVAAGDDARILATKKAIDDTQIGLAVQGVMWIASADDLSNLPAGARRFATNNAGVTVLPAAGYFFLEVLAKRDVANGSCILATSNTGDVWIGLRYTVPADANFTWIQLNQNVENLGLTEAVKRALNAVQKTGDTMTGNLFLKSDTRMHFAITDADGNARMWLFKDKGGDGVCINNGYDGGGDFILRKDGGLTLGSGTQIAPNGDILGGVWGSAWVTTWLSNAFTSRDNNINARATFDWVNQNCITRVMRGEPVNPGKVNEYGPAEAPAGCVVTSVRHDPTTAYGIYFTYRPLSVFINGAWRVIEG